MAEGAPLLREYRVYSSIEGSNPSHSASSKKPLSGAFLLPVVFVARVRSLCFAWVAIVGVLSCSRASRCIGWTTDAAELHLCRLAVQCWMAIAARCGMFVAGTVACISVQLVVCGDCGLLGSVRLPECLCAREAPQWLGGCRKCGCGDVAAKVRVWSRGDVEVRGCCCASLNNAHKKTAGDGLLFL